ncbi:hypothetical protein HDU67_009758 [Dinochytrium kinnereticum]|nr:hypothetical protein HDU67_009758 [Dinochytrium kinnereticum]
MGLLNTPLPYVPYPVMIRELDISGNAADNLYMGDLDAVLGMVPNLEVFRLENCFHISNILIQSLAHHCPNLLQLDLPGCPISDSFVPALTKKCRHLLRLDLSFTNVSIASIHPVILQSESLLELDLSECREADDLTSLDLSNKGFKRPLKSLNLRNTLISDDLLRFAISQCPELEIIVLESCPSVTDDAVIKIVNTCHRLRSLDCSFCDRITDLSLNALTVRAAASGGGMLEELYLSACDLITPAAVHQMVQKATKLELLVLDGCEKILGTYVQEFALDRTDELECSLEGEGLRTLASYNAVTSLATPPASPGRHLGGTPTDSFDSQLRVQVTYAALEGDADERRRRKPNSGFAAAIIRNVLAPGEAAASIAAAKEAAIGTNGSDGGSAASSPTGSSTPVGGSPGLQRRSSRTLRHRRSLLGLSSRPDVDEEDAVEAAKMERQEKIREKRRSRTSSSEYLGGGPGSNRLSFYPPPSPPPGVHSHSSYASSPLTAEPQSAEIVSPASTTTTITPKSAIDEAAAKAAFMAALAAKGVKVAAPGEEGAVPAPQPAHQSPSKRASTLSLKASEFVPSAPVSAPASVTAAWTDTAAAPSDAWNSATTATDPWDASAASAAGRPRKLSVGTPTGPPTPGSAPSTWTAPTGIAQSSVLASPASAIAPISIVPNVAAPAVPPSPASTEPGGGVLLFSGRAARAASMSKSVEPSVGVAPSEPIPTSSSPTPVDGVDGSILIASGRRRTRTDSIVQQPEPELAIDTSAAAVAGPASATTVPAWINQPPVSTVPPKAPSPWGTDPTVWNNPAQLTSSSSTWSTTNPAAAAGFVDPWARPSGVLGPTNITNSSDPWAAAPPGMGSTPSATPQPVQMNIPPSPVAVTPSSGVVAGPPGWPAPTTGAPFSPPVQTATSWGPSVPPSSSPMAAAAAASAKTPRPGVAGFVTTGGGRFGNVGVGARAAAAAAAPAPAPAPAAAWNGAAGASGTDGAKEAFVFSSTKRGRMLLKLKIETRAGGHQTLAVHELDDPVQLATEFVTYWDMAAFKEPLVRLISVRKTNVLRSRGHH